MTNISEQLKKQIKQREDTIKELKSKREDIIKELKSKRDDLKDESAIKKTGGNMSSFGNASHEELDKIIADYDRQISEHEDALGQLKAQ